MFKTFKGLIAQADFFSPEVKLKIKNENNYKNFLGGVLSLLCSLLVLSAVIYFLL